MNLSKGVSKKLDIALKIRNTFCILPDAWGISLIHAHVYFLQSLMESHFLTTNCSTSRIHSDSASEKSTWLLFLLTVLYLDVYIRFLLLSQCYASYELVLWFEFKRMKQRSTTSLRHALFMNGWRLITFVLHLIFALKPHSRSLQRRGRPLLSGSVARRVLAQQRGGGFGVQGGASEPVHGRRWAELQGGGGAEVGRGVDARGVGRGVELRMRKKTEVLKVPAEHGWITSHDKSLNQNSSPEGRGNLLYHFGLDRSRESSK